MRDLQFGAGKGGIEKLIAILDGYLATSNLTPLARAQYTVQRQWLVDEGARVTDGLVMFACQPGMAGVPTPTGGMALWLTITQTVSASDPLLTHPILRTYICCLP